MKLAGHIAVFAVIACLAIWRFTMAPIAGEKIGDFPEKEIHLVISASRDSPESDLANSFAQAITGKVWPTVPVRVDLRTGGEGSVARRFVASGKPDGYRILIHEGSGPEALSLKPFGRVGGAAEADRSFTFSTASKTPELTLRKLAAAMEKASLAEPVAEQLRALSVRTEWTGGEALRQQLAETVQTSTAGNKWKKSRIPNFPKIFLIIAVLLGIYCFLRLFWTGRPYDPERQKSNPAIGFLCYLVLFLYAYVLTNSYLPYLPATGLMVFLVGILICRFDRKKWLPLLEIACLSALGSELIFGAILSLPLP